MSLRQRKLVRATRILAKYFGIHSVKETAEMTVFNDINSNEALGLTTGTSTGVTIDISAPTEEEVRLITLLIDTADGAYTTVDFLNEFITGINSDGGTATSLSGNEDAENSFGRLIQVYYEKGKNFVIKKSSPEINKNIPEEVGNSNPRIKIHEIGIREMLGHGAPGTDDSFLINSSPANPTKNFPGLSIYVSNSPRVTIESQNLAASTIFLNGVPNVELMRAVPYVNVEFFFPRPPVSDIGQQLQNLSLNKFLLGAQRVESNSITETMAEADTVVGSSISSRAGTPDSPIPEQYSVAGMELFTSPQTLVNADDVSEAAKSNPILDKFRPLMTLQDLNITIRPSRGLISYKTGNISFVLHDRSRLAEVSEFIRSDLYGTNEITIEYGWSHPDGALNNNSDNPYGDLIDGLRIKEKFMVTNSSFTFDPTGQVNIKLNIAMRGSSEFNTELMSSDAATLGEQLRNIEELQRDIARLRQQVFPSSQATTNTEIRGVQILNAAQDATNNIVLSSDLRQALARFRAKFQNSRNPRAQELTRKLNELFGSNGQSSRELINGNTTNNGNPTTLAQIRTTIQASIRNKIEKLSDGKDPFLLDVEDEDDNRKRHITDRGIGREERTNRRNFERRAFTAGIGNHNPGPTSLARLLLLFVGQPLANTKKYDEVQMFFYPFNEYAGKASNLNIANFVVDLKYFADELARYRLTHVSRSSVMTLNQFMSFIADILIDDPAAASYGLWNTAGNLFRTKYTDPEGRVRGPTVPVDDPAVFQQKMEEVLRGVTPDGSFKPPQIGIHIETLPGKIGEEDGNDASQSSVKSILRLHIYDKVSTAYEPIGRMLQASKRNLVGSIGGIAATPAAEAGNTSVTRARREIAASAIASAENLGLIEVLNRDSDVASTGVAANDNSGKIYRIKGGPKKLKEFIMMNSPYIIFGAGGTTVKSAQLNSMQNSALATVNILRSFRREEGVTPSGENVGGLPMNIIPSLLNVECVGNPLINYMQSYFIDLQTGTTVDNMYAVTGVEHKFTQGDFTTSVKFTPIDAWGSYRSLVSTIGSSLTILSEANNEEQSGADTGNNNSGGS